MKTLPRPVTEAGSDLLPSVQAPAQPPVQPVTAGHLQDPILARALFAAWSGDRAVVIASPPGAGKTRRVTQLADQLTRRAGLAVAVAAQTRAQTLDVTSRIAALGCPVTLIGKARTPRPDGLHPAATWLTTEAGLRTTRGVVVATTARWRYLDPALYRADVLVVEEAWQSTFADFGALGGLAGQFVMVGDPGQIDPVVTGDTTRWERWDTGPHRCAPEAFTAAFPGVATQLRPDTTWRLGPVTTALIQPAFYPDLLFTSARPPRHISLDGTALPELAAHTAGTGRLCVALSRHRCHAHVLTDTATPAVLRAALTADPGNADLAAHRDVLAALAAIP